MCFPGFVWAFTSYALFDERRLMVCLARVEIRREGNHGIQRQRHSGAGRNPVSLPCVQKTLGPGLRLGDDG